MRLFALLALPLLLLACSPVRDLDGAVEPIGDFKLGITVANVVGDVTKGPLSRDVTTDEWKADVKQAFDRRFSRYDGGRLYHLGVTVLGYVVAQPGIPIVASPKSVLIFNVVVIDNETQKPLTSEPHQMTVIETFTGGNIFGSGLTSTKEEQIADLSNAAAKATDNWLRTQPWFFGADPVMQEKLQARIDAKAAAQ
ncbi:MAG: hypothetical protein ACPG5U_01220 [Planktomarina sp.]